MAKLVLIRHGESLWNRANRFTGWVDVPLSEKGRKEARKAGRLIRGIEFGRAYTSLLIRAIETLLLVLAEAGGGKIPIIKHQQGRMKDWGEYQGDHSQEISVFQALELNERYYGRLQGLNKTETAEKYGPEQVRLWRRSYDVPPPGGESLKETAGRTIPYLQKEILPVVRTGENVLVVAHGNSLRSIIMHLDDLGPEEVVRLELATGVPVIYEIDSDGQIKAKEVLKA
ncbi:2,3-bisphosphoglycerate-dependent phosphoglycerate mutase [Thermosulfuriphilus sp.]